MQIIIVIHSNLKRIILCVIRYAIVIAGSPLRKKSATFAVIITVAGLAKLIHCKCLAVFMNKLVFIASFTFHIMGVSVYFLSRTNTLTPMKCLDHYKRFAYTYCKLLREVLTHRKKKLMLVETYLTRT